MSYQALIAIPVEIPDAVIEMTDDGSALSDFIDSVFDDVSTQLHDLIAQFQETFVG